jgi:hypothetical protein
MNMIFFLLAAFLSIAFSQLWVNRYCQGLNNIPGPWLASSTNLWRLFLILGRRPEVVHKDLHRKYGDVVRMGPNFVSITDLETVKRIFSNPEYRKVSLPPGRHHNADPGQSPTCTQSSRLSHMERGSGTYSTSLMKLTTPSLEDR